MPGTVAERGIQENVPFNFVKFDAQADCRTLLFLARDVPKKRTLFGRSILSRNRTVLVHGFLGLRVDY